MKTSSLRFIAFVCVVLLARSAARAQVQTGTPPFGSFSGGPDIVNNANLNVHLDFPIFAKSGRGLPFSYVVPFDSGVWYPSGSAFNYPQVWPH